MWCTSKQVYWTYSLTWIGLPPTWEWLKDEIIFMKGQNCFYTQFSRPCLSASIEKFQTDTQTASWELLVNRKSALKLCCYVLSAKWKTDYPNSVDDRAQQTEKWVCVDLNHTEIELRSLGFPVLLERFSDWIWILNNCTVLLVWSDYTLRKPCFVVCEGEVFVFSLATQYSYILYSC